MKKEKKKNEQIRLVIIIGRVKFISYQVVSSNWIEILFLFVKSIRKIAWFRMAYGMIIGIYFTG